MPTYFGNGPKMYVSIWSHSCTYSLLSHQSLSDETLNRCLNLVDEPTNFTYLSLIPSAHRIGKPYYFTMPFASLALSYWAWCSLDRVSGLFDVHSDTKLLFYVPQPETMASVLDLVKIPYYWRWLLSLPVYPTYNQSQINKVYNVESTGCLWLEFVFRLLPILSVLPSESVMEVLHISFIVGPTERYWSSLRFAFHPTAIYHQLYLSELFS